MEEAKKYDGLVEEMLLTEQLEVCGMQVHGNYTRQEPNGVHAIVVARDDETLQVLLQALGDHPQRAKLLADRARRQERLAEEAAAKERVEDFSAVTPATPTDVAVAAILKARQIVPGGKLPVAACLACLGLAKNKRHVGAYRWALANAEDVRELLRPEHEVLYSAACTAVDLAHSDLAPGDYNFVKAVLEAAAVNGGQELVKKVLMTEVSEHLQRAVRSRRSAEEDPSGPAYVARIVKSPGGQQILDAASEMGEMEIRAKLEALPDESDVSRRAPARPAQPAHPHVSAADPRAVYPPEPYPEGLDGGFGCAVAETPWGRIAGKAAAGRCWYSYGGKEYSTDSDFAEVTGVRTETPQGLPHGHQTDNNSSHYCAVAHTQWGDVPGKARADVGKCMFPHNGKEHVTADFEYIRGLDEGARDS